MQSLDPMEITPPTVATRAERMLTRDSTVQTAGTLMRASKALVIVVALVLSACGGGGGDDGSGDGLTLDDFATARVSIDGVPFVAWLADSDAQHERGLMGVTEQQLAPLPDGTPRGMLFTFDSDRFASFFMRGTAAPLDLAYATSDGRIAEVHHLIPLDETPVVAQRLVRFAFEARAGTFAAHGIGIGDLLVVPAR